jgi:hypothetical protein
MFSKKILQLRGTDDNPSNLDQIITSSLIIEITVLV